MSRISNSVRRSLGRPISSALSSTTRRQRVEILVGQQPARIAADRVERRRLCIADEHRQPGVGDDAGRQQADAEQQVGNRGLAGIDLAEDDHARRPRQHRLHARQPGGTDRQRPIVAVQTFELAACVPQSRQELVRTARSLRHLRRTLQARTEIVDDDLELMIQGAAPLQPVGQRLRLLLALGRAIDRSPPRRDRRRRACRSAPRGGA